VRVTPGQPFSSRPPSSRRTLQVSSSEAKPPQASSLSSAFPLERVPSRAGPSQRVSSTGGPLQAGPLQTAPPDSTSRRLPRGQPFPGSLVQDTCLPMEGCIFGHWLVRGRILLTQRCILVASGPTWRLSREAAFLTSEPSALYSERRPPSQKGASLGLGSRSPAQARRASRQPPARMAHGARRMAQGAGGQPRLQPDRTISSRPLLLAQPSSSIRPVQPSPGVRPRRSSCAPRGRPLGPRPTWACRLRRRLVAPARWRRRSAEGRPGWRTR
jgi:hypothetical protein